MAFHKPGDFTRLVPFRHFDSCKGTLSTRWHPGAPPLSFLQRIASCTAYHLKSALSGDVMLCTSFHSFDSTREKGSGLDWIYVTYLWETKKADMIRLPRKTFSLTTIPFQKLEYKYMNAPGSHKTLDQHSPLMQWRVIEQLTLDLTVATADQFWFWCCGGKERGEIN